MVHIKSLYMVERELPRERIATLRTFLGNDLDIGAVARFLLPSLYPRTTLKQPEDVTLYFLPGIGTVITNGNKRFLACHLAGIKDVPEEVMIRHSLDSRYLEIFGQLERFKKKYGVTTVGEYARNYLRGIETELSTTPSPSTPVFVRNS